MSRIITPEEMSKSKNAAECKNFGSLQSVVCSFREMNTSQNINGNDARETEKVAEAASQLAVVLPKDTKEAQESAKETSEDHPPPAQPPLMDDIKRGVDALLKHTASPESHPDYLCSSSALKRPDSSPPLGWRDYLAKDIGWLVLNAASPILLGRKKPVSKQRALARELHRLTQGELGELLLRAVAPCEDPVSFLASLAWNRLRRSSVARDRFAIRAAIRDFVNLNPPPPTEAEQVEEICYQIVMADLDYAAGVPVAFWPSEFSARLKSDKYIPTPKGHIPSRPTERKLLEFFDANPCLSWKVRDKIVKWLKRGSRLETYRQAWGSRLPEKHVVVDIYPEEHAFWMSPNLVALRGDVEQMRRKYRCVQQVVKLSAFLRFRFDPERVFAPKLPHNLLGFLCSTEELLNSCPNDLYLTKLRRALAPFLPKLYCEEEEDDAPPPPIEAVPAGDVERLPDLPAEDDDGPPRRRIGLADED